MAKSPDQIQNLYAWYAASAETAYADTDPVGTITDLSTNGRDLTATSTARPLYQTNIVNGYPVYRFDGSNDLAQASAAADWKFLHDGSQFTVFVVWKTRVAEPDSGQVIWGTNTWASSSVGVVGVFDDRSAASRNQHPVFFMSKGSAPAVFDSTAISQAQYEGPSVNQGALGNQWHISIYRLFTDTADYVTMLTDGAGGSLAALDNVSGYSASNPAYPLTVGATGAGTFPFDGDIAEIAIFDAGLANADLQALSDWYASKYALKSVKYPGPTTTVASESGFNGFPGATVVGSKVVVGYRSGTSHTSADGAIRVKISSDGGSTFGGYATVLSSASYDYRDTTLLTLTNGRVIMASGRRTSAPADIVDGTALVYSDTQGSTWETEINPNDSFTSYSRFSGGLVQLANGDVLLTVYGKDSGDTYTSVRLMKSTDNGATWAMVGDLADGETDTQNYNETGLVVGSDLNLYAIIRDETDTDWKMSSSSDSGITWSAPATIISSMSGMPRPLKDADGSIWVIGRISTLDDRSVSLSSIDDLATIQVGYPFGFQSTPQGKGAYGQPFALSPGRLGFIFANESAGATDAHVWLQVESQSSVAAGIPSARFRYSLMRFSDKPNPLSSAAPPSDVSTASANDTSAIHDNVAGEISALTLVTAASGDHILIEDADDSNNKKRVAASDFLGGGASPLTTKGDLYTYTTTDARLAVGTDGYVLTADSAESAGIKWAASAGGTSFSGCRLTKSTPGNLPTSETSVTWDTESYDTDSYHSTSTNTERITIPTTGYYRFWAGLDASLTSGNFYMYLQVDGSGVATALCRQPGFSPQTGAYLTDVLSLSASSYVVLRLNASSASGINRIYFGCEKVGT